MENTPKKYSKLKRTPTHTDLITNDFYIVKDTATKQPIAFLKRVNPKEHQCLDNNMNEILKKGTKGICLEFCDGKREELGLIEPFSKIEVVEELLPILESALETTNKNEQKTRIESYIIKLNKKLEKAKSKTKAPVIEEAKIEEEEEEEEFAVGGNIGQTVSFNDWSGEPRTGTIIEQLEDGNYSVSSGYGNVLVQPSMITSYGKLAEPKKKFFDFFEKGGNIEWDKYNKERKELVIKAGNEEAVLRDKLSNNNAELTDSEISDSDKDILLKIESIWDDCHNEVKKKLRGFLPDINDCIGTITKRNSKVVNNEYIETTQEVIFATYTKILLQDFLLNDNGISKRSIYNQSEIEDITAPKWIIKDDVKLFFNYDENSECPLQYVKLDTITKEINKKDGTKFEHGGNTPTELKGYRVDIYKSDYNSPMNLVSFDKNSAILVTDGKKGSSQTVMSDQPYLKLIKRNIGGKDYLSAEPVNYGSETAWKMFGGTFIWSSDSRFRQDVSAQPVPLHDRVEMAEGGNVPEGFNLEMEAKAIEFITGTRIDLHSLHKDGINYAFKYRGHNKELFLNAKFIQDTIQMHKKSLEGRTLFEEGGNITQLESGAINYLGELWFAIKDGETSKYKELADALDKLQVPFKIQNLVSMDAETFRGRKSIISTEEVQQRIAKILKENNTEHHYEKGGDIDEKCEYAVGGNIGQTISFNDWAGEPRTGTIIEKLDDGNFSVSSGYGNVLVHPYMITSYGQEAEPRKKLFGLFEEGGNISGKKYFIKLDDGSKKEFHVEDITLINGIYFAMGYHDEADKGAVYVHYSNALRPLFNEDGTNVTPMPEYAGKEYWDFKKVRDAENDKKKEENTAKNWWRLSLSDEEENALLDKYKDEIKIDEVYVKENKKTIKTPSDLSVIHIWKAEGSPIYSETLDEKYDLGDLTNPDLQEKINIRERQRASSKSDTQFGSGGTVGMPLSIDAKDVYGFRYTLDLTKSRKENALIHATKYANENNKRVTKKLIEHFETTPEPFWEVRDLVEDKKIGSFLDSVKIFKYLYPLVHKDWQYALDLGLVYKSKQTEGNYANTPYIYNDELAVRVRENGLNNLKPIIEEILSSDKYEEGGNIYSDERAQEIASTILMQLGGTGRLKAFVGASNFVYDKEGSVSFKFKGKKANYVRITLNAMDYYDVVFKKISGMNVKVVSELNDVDFEQLIPFFERETGMYLRFEDGGNLFKGGGVIPAEEPKEEPKIEEPKVEEPEPVAKVATYVPNRDIKDLTLFIKDKYVTVEGTSILDGVYLKKSFKQKLAQKNANPEAIYKKIKSDTKSLDVKVKELASLKLEDIKEFIELGATEEQIRNIYLGYSFDHEVKEAEFAEYKQDNLWNWSDEYRTDIIKRYKEAFKNQVFQLAFEYPDFDWKKVIEKYAIELQPKTYSDDKGSYQVFEGNGLVFANQYGRFDRFDKKLVEDKSLLIKSLNKPSAYQKEREVQAGLNSSYWTMITRSSAIIDDVLNILFSQEEAYAKEISVYIDTLTDMHPETFDKLNIKYEDGGNIDKINFKEDVKYYPVSDIREIRLTNDRVINATDAYGLNIDKDKTKEYTEIFSGLYASKRPIMSMAETNQLSLFEKGGKLPVNSTYIKRSDIDSVLVFDEEQNTEIEIPANKVLNGFWYDNSKQNELIKKAKKEGLLK